MPTGNPGQRRRRVNCSICGAEGVNARTCPGNRAEHEQLVKPKVEAPFTRSNPGVWTPGTTGDIWGSLRPWAPALNGENLGPMSDDLPDPIDVEEIIHLVEVTTPEPATIAESLERIALALEAMADVLGA